MAYHEPPEQIAALDGYAADMRAQLSFEAAHPRFDPQHQPDGGYYDAEAERRSDLAELQYARREDALEAPACDESELLADLSDHPIWDPRLQLGGRYCDDTADRRGDLNDICHAGDVAVGFFEHPDPNHQLVPDAVLALLHNTVGAKSAEAMVSAALKSWMNGHLLTQREQRIVDVVCDANYATQIGRLCLPAH